jgi:sugar-phosphatase
VEKREFPRKISAVLVDCDGVLVDSVALSNRALRLWSKRVGFEPGLVIRAAQGRRMSEVISALLPSERVEAEIAFFAQLELSMASDARACPGAREFLNELNSSSHWAIVTSADEAVARARLAAAGLPAPPVLIAAGDVTKGKPAPDCYLAAAHQLGVSPERCLALDDLAIGVESARGAGAMAVLVGTESDGVASVPSLKQVRLVISGDELEVSLAYPEVAIGIRRARSAS